MMKYNELQKEIEYRLKEVDYYIEKNDASNANTSISICLKLIIKYLTNDDAIANSENSVLIFDYLNNLKNLDKKAAKDIILLNDRINEGNDVSKNYDLLKKIISEINKPSEKETEKEKKTQKKDGRAEKSRIQLDNEYLQNESKYIDEYLDSEISKGNFNVKRKEEKNSRNSGASIVSTREYRSSAAPETDQKRIAVNNKNEESKELTKKEVKSSANKYVKRIVVILIFILLCALILTAGYVLLDPTKPSFAEVMNEIVLPIPGSIFGTLFSILIPKDIAESKKAFLLLMLIMDIIAFGVMGYDKLIALQNRNIKRVEGNNAKTISRVPEKVLLMLGAIGGAKGEILGMLFFRHKKNKAKFYLGLPLFAIIHAFIYLAI